MLYQRVRPQKFEDIIGNKQVVESLKKLVKEKSEKRPHAFLFHGPSGTGKTTLARILAKEFGCEGISLTEVNAANLRGIESVREISDSAILAPMFGDSKAFIFDESHQFTPAAQQALLKVIEDCPKFVYFIFCTTDPSQLILTIRNRCAKYQIVGLRPSELRDLISRTAKQENITITDDIIDVVSKAAEGCPRQALMLLEQIQKIDNPKEILEYLASSETSKKEVIDLCREVISLRPDRWFTCIKIFQSVDVDAESIRLAILGYLKKVLFSCSKIEEAGRIVELITIFEKNTYSGGAASLLKQIFHACLVD
jgi:DNA polymerase-3 subunit gamma/tau